MNTPLDCVHCIQQLEHSPTLMKYSKHHICQTHSTTLDTRQTTHPWKQQAVINICVCHRRQLFTSQWNPNPTQQTINTEIVSPRFIIGQQLYTTDKAMRTKPSPANINYVNLYQRETVPSVFCRPFPLHDKTSSHDKPTMFIHLPMKQTPKHTYSFTSRASENHKIHQHTKHQQLKKHHLESRTKTIKTWIHNMLSYIPCMG